MSKGAKANEQIPNPVFYTLDSCEHALIRHFDIPYFKFRPFKSARKEKIDITVHDYRLTLFEVQLTMKS